MKTSPKNPRTTAYRLHEDVQEEIQVRHFYRLYQQLRSGNILYVMGSGAQIAAGLVLVLLAVTGHIDRTWAATLASAIGSVVSMTGAYLMYDLLRNKSNVDHLVKDAINRAISHLN